MRLATLALRPVLRLAHAPPVRRARLRRRRPRASPSACSRPNLGSEFVPRLSEGAIVVNVVRLAGHRPGGVDPATTRRWRRLLLAEFPDEVEHVWSRVGTAEVATDPMGSEETDMFITLKPRDRWKRAARRTNWSS